MYIIPLQPGCESVITLLHVVVIQVDLDSKGEEKEENNERNVSPEHLTSTSEGENSSQQSPLPPHEVTRATSPDVSDTTSDKPSKSPDKPAATPPENKRAAVHAAPAEQSYRPASVQSLRSSSQPLLHSKHYKQYERTSTPLRWDIAGVFISQIV